MAGSASGLLANPAIALITTPLADRVGNGFASFRSLSHWVLAHNYAAVSEEIGGWDSGEAWESLKRIIVEQVGVRPEIVTRETSFVNDLGLD